jgi:hypothetical protein
MTDYITIKLPILDGTPALDDDGEDTERVCSLCGKGVAFYESSGDIFGDPATKDADRVVLSARFGTVHADCYRSWADKMEIREAWLTIAVEIAKRPRAFSAAEVRAALTALVRFAGGAA